MGHKILFLELFSPYLQKNDPGDRFYKDFIPIAKKCMPGTLWKPIHALRHGFADTLKQAGVSEGVIEDIQDGSDRRRPRRDIPTRRAFR